MRYFIHRHSCLWVMLTFIAVPAYALEGCPDEQHAKFTVIKRDESPPFVGPICLADTNANFDGLRQQVVEVLLDSTHQISLYTQPNFSGTEILLKGEGWIRVTDIVRSFKVQEKPPGPELPPESK